MPSTNHLTMRPTTSSGVEKKNGGRSLTPKIGTVVPTCQIAIADHGDEQLQGDAESRRDRHSSAPRLGVALEHLVLQHLPDLAVQLVEGRVELDLGDVARARQRHAPVADDARAPARPT